MWAEPDRSEIGDVIIGGEVRSRGLVQAYGPGYCEVGSVQTLKVLGRMGSEVTLGYQLLFSVGSDDVPLELLVTLLSPGPYAGGHKVPTTPHPAVGVSGATDMRRQDQPG